MPKPSCGAQPEFSRNDHNEKTRRITRDLTSLQREIRDDFDQRISDLASILQKFKTLMVTDIKSLSTVSESDEIPTLTTKIDDSTLAEDKLIAAVPVEDNKPPRKTDPLAAYRETARFEAGLYQLNCQLYRFRLELDQELEFREEPLHQHFHDDSELAEVLKRITEKSRQEKQSDT